MLIQGIPPCVIKHVLKKQLIKSGNVYLMAFSITEMKSNFSVNDKVIVVTGATGVLGHSFINALAEEGAIVGVLGRNEKVATQRVKEIVQNGGKAITLIADVTDEQQLLSASKLLLNEFGKN